MAANTALILSFQSKDWEIIMGIMNNYPSPVFAKLKQTLQNYYSANVNPAPGTVIQVVTKEQMAVLIFTAMYGASVYLSYNDTGASPFKRIVDYLRTVNNVADNYISLQLAAQDAWRDGEQTKAKKTGREVLQMDSYDNT